MDYRLGAARHDHVRASKADHVETSGDRLRARGTGAGQAVGSSPRAHLDARLRGRAVRHQHRQAKRRHSTRASVLHHVIVPQERGDAADPGADRHANPLAVRTVITLIRLAAGPPNEACVRPRLPERDDRELGAAVEPADLQAVEDGGRVNGRPGSDSDGQSPRPVFGQRADAGTAVEQTGPRRLHVPAQRRDGAEAGDHSLRQALRHDCFLSLLCASGSGHSRGIPRSRWIAAKTAALPPGVSASMAIHPATGGPPDNYIRVARERTLPDRRGHR
jgi:hypothetical protein